MSADGKRVATAAADAVVVHDLESGALLRRIRLAGSVRSLRVSPDGRFASLIDQASRALVFDLNSGKKLHEIAGCIDAMVTRDAHRDRLILVRKRGAVSIHDLRTGVETHYVEVGLRGPWATDFTSDGTRVIGVQNDRAFVWSTASRRAKVYEVAARRDRLAYELSPRGTLLITRGPRRAWLWRTGTATRLAELPRGQYAFRHDDRRLLIYGEGAWYWDTASPHQLRKLTSDPVAQGAISRDGKYVATRDRSGQVRLWSGFHGALLHVAARPAVEIGFAHPSSRLLVRHGDGTMSVIVSRTGRVARNLSPSSPIQSFATASDHLLTLHADGNATMWSASTGERRFELDQKEPIRSPSLHPTGEILAARAGDRVIVWRAKDGRHVQTIRWAGAPRLLGDGARVLIGADPTDEGDGPSLWNAQTGQLLEDFGSGRSDGMAVLENVAVVPNQRWLTAGRGRALIDVRTGHKLMSIGAATRGSWFPDASRFLLVGSTDPDITAIVELPFPREVRPPELVHEMIAARSPWQVIDGRLLPKKQEPAHE